MSAFVQQTLRAISCQLAAAALASCAGTSAGLAAAAERGPHAALEAALRDHDDRTNGSLGACVIAQSTETCVNGDRRYSMQSVMKLLVAIAAFDAVDQGRLRLDETIVVRREDLSLYVQPIAKFVTDEGYRTTVEDLIRRAVIDSDSAATDILLRKLGGPPKVQALLRSHGIGGVRIDRDERHLQTDIVGLTWRPEFVDPAVLDRAIAGVSEERRRKAHAEYVADIRDTATPRGMARLLEALASGRLLMPQSTARLLAILKDTRTFPTRLRAGAPEGWQVGHKTGSSGSTDGVVTATNDVGIYFPPHDVPMAIAVFLGSSSGTASERDAAIANVGKLAVEQLQDRQDAGG